MDSCEVRETTAPKVHFLTATEKETIWEAPNSSIPEPWLSDTSTPRRFVIIQKTQHLPSMPKALGFTSSVTKKEKNEQKHTDKVLHSQMSTHKVWGKSENCLSCLHTWIMSHNNGVQP